jgi:hypothetical protein
MLKSRLPNVFLALLFFFLFHSTTVLAQQQQQQQQRPPNGNTPANPPSNAGRPAANPPANTPANTQARPPATPPARSPVKASPSPNAGNSNTKPNSAANAAPVLINANTPACLDYSLTANLSTVGANSTYRSLFLQASTSGGLYDKRMFDSAVLKLPALTADKQLNRACGNLTTVAFVEAAKNYTRGTVLQFDDMVFVPISAPIWLVPLTGVIALVIMGTIGFAE